MKRRKQRILMAKAMGVILTVMTFLILYVPILLILMLSLNDSARGYQWEGFTLKWYAMLFLDDIMKDPIVNTISIAILSTIISTILGTIFAIGIHALEKKRRVRMMVMNNVPVVNPDIVTGISLMIIFSILSFTLGFSTVLIAHVFFSIPYVILNIIPKLKRLDPNLYEAGLDLGCSRIEAVWRVIIPNISTGILTGALMAFTMSIDDFVITYFTSGNEYMNVSTWLYAALAREGRNSFTPVAYAYNTIIFLLTIIIIVFVNTRKERKVRTHEKSTCFTP
ncbi:MAG: ABC transporter permease [Candidatus Izemoplasmatales bacterium]|nr:ABC transporter permease [Candidatus Izemoplasmatales bacterium]